MNYPKPLPWMDPDEIADAMITNRNQTRYELRERALYNAVNLHCETGDAMDRQTAAADVLATAQEFYDWITEDLSGHPNPETLCTCGHEQDEHDNPGGCQAFERRYAGRELHCRCTEFDLEERN